MNPILFTQFKLVDLALGKACQVGHGGFLGLPPWYEYLQGVATYATGSNSTDANPTLICSPAITGLSDIWLIVAAAIEILLRLAALSAIVFVIVGAVQFIISQGEPDKTAKARGTVITALAGLAIAVVAATLVTFIAGRFNS
jgi:hypothetical protein